MDEVSNLLRQSVRDRRLSRGERQALATLLSDESPTADEIARLQNLAFELAREAVSESVSPGEMLDWLEDVVEALRTRQPTAPKTLAEACFSPGNDCRNRIVGLLDAARVSADLCVFTITDDRLTDTIISAHGRGVTVRIVTDDSKATDLGSDIDRLAAAGVEVRVDRSRFHMHHKFAILDRRTIVTGSYNWTLGAARDNEENIVVLDDPRLIAQFEREFDRLWQAFA
jgi:cardiolipin hydrolase